MKTNHAFEQKLYDIQLAAAKRRYEKGERTKRIAEGKESKELLQVSLVQSYFHTLGFTNALRYLYARCDIPEIRDEIAEGLYEEETGGITGTDSHVNLFYNFAEAFDLPREKLINEAWLIPEMAGIIHLYHYAATHMSVIEGIAVLNFAAEGQNQDIEGYKGVAGVTYDIITNVFGKSGDAVTFSYVHSTADQEHAAVGRRVIAQNTHSPEEQDRVLAVIDMCYAAFESYNKAMSVLTLDDCWKRRTSYFYQ